MMVPSWFAHGSRDTTVPTRFSRTIAEDLEAHGADYFFKEVEGKSHYLSGFLRGNDLTKQLITWLAERVRDPNPRRVDLATVGLYHGASYWLRIDDAPQAIEDLLGNKNVALVIAGMIALLMLARQKRNSRADLAAAVQVALASGGIIIPIPALATVCTASAFLNPLLIGLIAGFAETLGETTGYFLGYSGRAVITQTRIYLRLEGWMRRRGWVLLFLISVIPNPIFDIIGVAAGALAATVKGAQPSLPLARAIKRLLAGLR
ncbi:MAG: VTT domain-containing protein [Gemmatimonadetes bacterium]|nr:VTT domain-containing protein [Gemmatimonadota bacterium]